MAVYGRREFVCLSGGSLPRDRAAQAAERGRRDAGRARKLLDAIKERFPDDGFEAFNQVQAARDPRLGLQLAQIVTDIERGHTPTAHHVYALAAAAGWSFERVCLALDIDFANLPRLHAMLGGDRTYIERSGYGVAGPVALPTDLVPGVTRRSMSLTEMVVDWSKPTPAADWADHAIRPLLGRIGRLDNVAYPRLPSGASLLVDAADTVVDSEGYFAVQHPNGYSCARLEADSHQVSVLSEDRQRYPRLDFQPQEVRVIGRLRAWAGDVSRYAPPRPVNSSDLIDSRRALIDPVKWRELTSPAMLRDIWVRRDLSFGQFERKVEMLRRVAGRRFTIGRGHMHDLMQADAVTATTTKEPMPRLERLFVLAAIFLLSPYDLFRGYGVPVDNLSVRAADEVASRDRARAQADRLREHPLVAHLISRGWDLAWLLARYRRPRAGRRLFYLDEISPGMTPLIKPAAFISVNLKDRRIKATLRGQPVESLRDWERPVYLLQTSGRQRFVCGYCDVRGDFISVIPHPDAPSQRVQRFRNPEHAVVLGRITNVATLTK